jgi:hypothetical protein
MPSDSGVDGGGSTSSFWSRAIPVTESSSPTLALSVRTDCGRPSTTSVTFFWIARWVRPTESTAVTSAA